MRFIRTQQVREMIGVGRTTLWEMVRDGSFPRPVRITERISGYRLDAVQQWMRLRVRGLAWPSKGKSTRPPRGLDQADLVLARRSDADQGASR